MAYCFNCGTLLDRDAKFCGNCGHNVSAYNIQRYTPVIHVETAEEIEAKKIKKGFSRAFFGCGIIFLAMSVIGAFFEIIGMILNVIINPVAEYVDSQSLENNVTQLSNPQSLLQMIFIVMGSAVGITVGIIIMRLVLKKNNMEPVEKHSLNFGQFIMIAGITLGLWAVGVFIGNFPSFLGFDLPSAISAESETAMIPEIIYAIIGAPILEELAFRKVLINGTHKYGETVSAFVSALTFGIIHGNSGQFFLAFFVGLVFATVYIKTGRVIYTMILHMIVNFTASLIEILVLILNPDEATLELMSTVEVFALIGFAVIGILLAILCRKNKILALKRPETGDMNRLTFKNAGARVYVIAGTVLLGITDLIMIISGLAVFYETMAKNTVGYCILYALLNIICTGLSIAVIIITIKTVGKHSAKKEEPEEIRLYE